ncbi:hypothetical protein [uncultured Parolsenella sp.]|uniref:hypothetical protein n=1 Tax=uncultured Parolsenella sp. TaxID=2083008 RepID=UPI0027D9787D|nr:hypothetical protein [uncultured Parolsenella sp.]
MILVDNRFGKEAGEAALRQILESMDLPERSGEFDFSRAPLIRKDGSEKSVYRNK